MGRTFLYMTPECLIEFEQASRSSDIWSLVATHLEIFTKSVPWTVKKQRQFCSLMATKVLRHALQHLSEKYRFVVTMLHNDPALRPEASPVLLCLKTVAGQI